MSKTSKISKAANITTRLRVQKQDMTLPKLFDMMALISFLGAVAFTGATYLIQNKLDTLLPTNSRYAFWTVWVRVAFSLMMYCLTTFGTSYGLGRFMKDQEYDQVKYFRLWFAAQLIMAALLIIGLGVFY